MDEVCDFLDCPLPAVWEGQDPILGHRLVLCGGHHAELSGHLHHFLWAPSAVPTPT